MFVGSKYARVPKANTVSASGELVGLYEMCQTTVQPVNSVETYVVGAGDTFESLAHKHLGSGAKWYILADMNPHIFFPLDLVAGDRIVIPSRNQAFLS
jgi:nucleoid-associated protein YgaU